MREFCTNLYYIMIIFLNWFFALVGNNIVSTPIVNRKHASTYATESSFIVLWLESFLTHERVRKLTGARVKVFRSISCETVWKNL